MIHGANGQGKTSLLEAIAWIARSHSFRGVSDAPLVRNGGEQAIVRAEIMDDDRLQLFEAELPRRVAIGCSATSAAITRARDLHGLLRVAVFAPDDLDLVKGGPSTRRVYLDELLGMLAVRYDAARTDLERVLKQRNTLLRSGVRDSSAVATLDVLDDQLVHAAAELVRGPPAARRPARARGQRGLRRTRGRRHDRWRRPTRPSGRRSPLGIADTGAVEGFLRAALVARRRAEIKHGVTLVGPHHDDWKLTIEGLDAVTRLQRRPANR